MDALATILSTAGFQEKPPSDLPIGRSFTGKKIGDFLLSAYFSSRPEWTVDVSIHREMDDVPVGTRHRFHSAEALERRIDAACTALAKLAADPSLLLCPLCGTRYVEVKERYKDGGAFLSCSGMTIHTRRIQGVRVKEIPCRGVSKKIPAQVDYR